MRRSLILAGSFFLIPIIVQAQGRGGAGMGHAGGMAFHGGGMSHAAPSGMAHVSSGTRMVARTGMSRMRAPGSAVRMIPRSNTLRTGRTANRQLTSNTIGVPGRGVNSRRFGPGRRNPIDRRRNRRAFEAFFPFFDGGFFLPSYPLGDDEGAADDGQQEEAYADEAPQGPQYPPYQGQEPPVVSRGRIPETPHQTEEYVFVRRDGSLFFAVAYAWDSGTLRYVTTEGLRRSVARDALDLDATQQFNEQRGMNFHSPA
jgi:hypothetical protein